jgi:hypothetical protein
VLAVPVGTDLTGTTVEIDPAHEIPEITICNNAVKLPGGTAGSGQDH